MIKVVNLVSCSSCPSSRYGGELNVLTVIMTLVSLVLVGWAIYRNKQEALPLAADLGVGAAAGK